MPEIDSTRLAESSAGHVSAPQCPTVYHDGSCPLCQREIALARKITDGVNFVDVSAAETGDIGPGMTADAAMKRFHVRRSDGVVVSGAAAFLEMWSKSPRLKWLESMAQRPLLVAVLDRFYSAFLVIRPTISGLLKPLER